MKNHFLSALVASVTLLSANAISAPLPNGEVVCTYAPSQSKLVTATLSAAGGAAATTSALGAALGISVVTHSSGALILSGAGGYIAGTIGTAIVAPVIISVGIVVGTVATTVELICAPKNHPSEVARIRSAAEEFVRRSELAAAQSPAAIIEAKKATIQFATKVGTKLEKISGDVFEYAYRHTQQ